MNMMNRSSGFTLLEVLIAFVILVIGVLGASIVIIRGSQINMYSYEADQVAVLADAFVERVRANPVNADKYTELSPSGGGCTAQSTSKDDKGIVELELACFKEQLAYTKLPNINFKVTKQSQKDATVLGSKNNVRYLLRVTWGGTKSGEQQAYLVDYVIANPDPDPDAI